jgi:hypothetical protein
LYVVYYSPVAEFGAYETRLKNLNFIVPSKDTPVVVYADQESAETPGQFKAFLEQCGYTNVHAATHAEELMAASPAMQTTPHPVVVPYCSAAEIQALHGMGAIIVDVRDASEIEKEKDGFKDHVNIPWNTFADHAPHLSERGHELMSTQERGKDTPLIILW